MPTQLTTHFRPRLEILEDRTAPANLPPGFAEAPFAAGLIQPTAMEFAPDGRVFVTEKTGALRVVAADGTLLPTPFLTVAVNSDSERGLLSVEFDPNFTTNRFIYVYYTAATSTPVNRVSRFTASATNPNIAQAGSEVILINGIASTQGNHNGGALHFGLDGKLYVAVGEAGVGANAQTLANLNGKILRINADGTIPVDNPFVNTQGARGEIWALGLRNPYTFNVHPTTGEIFVNDVGGSAFEEINRLVRGGNYGWPIVEGIANDPRFINPVHAYPHGASAAITGGVFYTGSQFPSTFLNSYFFGDFQQGFIRRLAPGASSANAFADGISGLVDIDLGPDGALYYLSLFQGTITRVATAAAASSGVFLLDGSNRLLAYNSDTDQTVNTGGFATRISAGVDANGNGQVYFTDGDNRLYRYSQGVFTFTGGYATAIFGGQGQCFFLDGANRIYIYHDNGTFTTTGGFAKTVSLGRDSSGLDELFFTDGDNRLYRYRQGVFTLTGGFAISLAAGRQGQVAFTDGLGQLYLFRDTGGFTATGVTVKAFSDGLDANGNDLFYLIDSANRLQFMRLGILTDTGNMGLEVKAGRGGFAAFTDLSRRLHLYREGGSATPFGTIATGLVATLKDAASVEFYFLNGSPPVTSPLEVFLVDPQGLNDLDVFAKALAPF